MKHYKPLLFKFVVFIFDIKELPNLTDNYNKCLFLKMWSVKGVQMDIILKGQHNMEEMVESLHKVLQLFQQQYQIDNFRNPFNAYFN